MGNTTRFSISLPTPVFEDLDHISTRMGISRSAVLTQMLADGLMHARRLVDCVPADPSDYSVARYRGDSRAIIKDRLQVLLADIDKA